MHQREASPHPWAFLPALEEAAEQVLLWLREDERWDVEEVKPLPCVLLALSPCPARPGLQGKGRSSQVAPKDGALVGSALWGAQLSPPSPCPQWRGEEEQGGLLFSPWMCPVAPPGFVQAAKA